MPGLFLWFKKPNLKGKKKVYRQKSKNDNVSNEESHNMAFFRAEANLLAFQTVPKCTRHKVTKNTEGTSGKTNHLVKLALKENGKICLDKFEKLII